MNRIDDRELKKIEGVDTLVINALRKDITCRFHAGRSVAYLLSGVAPCLPYLTHISHQMGRHATEERALPEGVHFAYDGLTVEIPD